MELSLSNSLAESIEEPVRDVIVTCVESSVDSLIDSDILSRIPFVSLAVAGFKIGKTVVEYHHLQQLVRFIDQINKRTYNEEDLKKYKQKFWSMDRKKRDRELEYVIVITSHFISEDKPCLLANLYLAYLELKIDWNQFVVYSEIINRLLPGDIETLKTAEFNNIDVKKA